MSEFRAESGQIWRCIKECATNYDKGERRVIIEKDELVEFRYWHPANFRTVENKYYAVEKRDFYYHFEYAGKIYEDVRFKNRNTLKEILDCNMWEPVKTE